MHVDEIPVAHTPAGGWGDVMPAPILAGCDDALSSDAPDLRGTWRVVHAEHDGTPLPDVAPVWQHVERVEQAADRVVITAAGIIHDMRADGTYERGVNDVMQTDYTTRIVVAASFDDGALVLRPQGVDDVEVRRWRDGADLMWQYGPFFTARLERVDAPG